MLVYITTLRGGVKLGLLVLCIIVTVALVVGSGVGASAHALYRGHWVFELSSLLTLA